MTMQLSNIQEVVTTTGIMVDSIAHTVWKSHKDGIKEISANEIGVSINWNMGTTFVPWSNIRYVR